MSTRFDACLAWTLRPENDGQPLHTTPGDAGGATAYGIPYRAMCAFLGWTCTTAEFSRMSSAARRAFYWSQQWCPVNGDALPPGWDLMAFDFGVLAGAGTSARLLQAAVGVVVDGNVGPRTCAAVAAAPAAEGITRLAAAQVAHLATLAGWAEFGGGWSARGERRCAAALASVSETCR